MTGGGVVLHAQGGGRYRVEGELGFDTVPALWEESRSRFGDDAPREIDLGGVTRSDSAAVALLIEWLRQERSVVFRNLPAQLLAIAEAGGAAPLLSR